METSLHRQLKEQYAGTDGQTEVTCDGYRIDAVDGDELIEVQQASLTAIRDKVGKLLKKHRVRVVKPIVVRKQLVKCRNKAGKEISRRMSPKRGVLLDLVHDLIYFTRVFPHRRLHLEVPLVEVEEWRYPRPKRQRRWRRKDYLVLDRKLVNVVGVHHFHTAEDLRTLIPHELPTPFHTGHVADALDADRRVAQRLVYCLRKMGTAKQVGKLGRAPAYEFTEIAQQRAA
jgi:hypothetical protein